MELLKKLEEVKQLGSYDVSLTYGEGVGCDDNDVPAIERSVTLLLVPVGCVGEARVVWKGKMGEFLEYDFRGIKPKLLSNPPSKEEQEEITGGGYFLFGTERALENLEKMWPLKESNDS